MNSKKREKLLLMLIAFLAPGILYLIVWALLGGYPFGDRNILLWDMNQQYVDFFSYFKNLLNGDASLGYSFTKSLGGSNVGLYAYYLSSPLNLLVFFFEDIKLFFVILTILKFSLCGLTSCIYFGKHFSGLSKERILLLSQTYALMSYTVLQMSNIMWIDGVILLPLLLMAVDFFVYEKRGIYIALAVGGLILCNWYSAYMSILFSAFYFLVLYLGVNGKKGIKSFFVSGFQYIAYNLLGIGLSAVLFVPTIISLFNGKGNELLSQIKFGFRESVIEIIQGNVIGALGNSNQLNLFCSGLVFVLALCFYFNGNISWKKRLCYFILSFLLVLSAIFTPTDCVWNGLRYAASYFCRYGYVIIMSILILAGNCMENYKIEKISKSIKMFVISFAALLVGFFLNYKQLADSKRMLYITILFLIAEMFLFVWSTVLTSQLKRQLVSFMLIGVIWLELSLNMYESYKNMYLAYNSDYKEYSDKVTQQIAAIQNQDDGSSFYRIETTKHRLDCSMSENLAYGYAGISHYSSTLEQNVSDMLHNLGYTQSNRMPFYRCPILTSDSLLGVKYVISEYNIPGEEKRGDYYYNPYALSLGIFTEKKIKNVSLENSNPFEYQNELFSALAGEDIRLFEKVDYSTVEKNKWEVQGTDGDVIYGYIDMHGKRTVNLRINEEDRGKYSVWNSIKVFGLDFSTSNKSVIELTGEYDESTTFEPVIYKLDMSLFETVINQLKSEQLQIKSIEDGNINGSYTAAKDGYMLLTIPYDKGWCVTVNGKEKNYKEVLGCFLAIPVSEGENVIVMNYHVRGLKIGFVISVMSLIIVLIIFCCYVRKRKSNSNGIK